MSRTHNVLTACSLLLAACSFSPSSTSDQGRSPKVAQVTRGFRNELTKQPSAFAVALESGTPDLQPGQDITLVFTINRNAIPVQEFKITHEKLLHLVVVRNDLEQFQHLHPEFDAASSRFTVPITFAANGTYALFADFTPANGEATVLRKDIVIGAPTTAITLEVDDGERRAGAYTVTPSIVSPIPAGVETTLVFTVSKGAAPVTDLQNYLDVKGHAVILKEGSLEYFHTHPSEHGAGHGDTTEAPGPGEVHFAATLPTPGRYKVFAQFRPEGNLITVANVYEVVAPPSGVDLGAGHAGEASAAREIRIEAFQFDYAPSEIRVKVGEPVDLILTTRDVAHSFSVEGLDLNATILPGKETRLAFTPERAGRYHFGCDVYCGTGHPTMAREGGTLVVE